MKANRWLGLAAAALLAGLWGTWSQVAHTKEKLPLCAPTPLSKPQILGELPEGTHRAKHQRLELDLREMLREAAKVRRLREAALPVWTPQRRQRAQEVGAERVVTRWEEIVRDRRAAVALGKMFFWDMRFGSDGQTACASCHYRAGTDNRVKSFGMAQGRVLIPGRIQNDGLEPSKSLTGPDILRIYENRWKGMVHFPGVLEKQAKRAINYVTELLARHKLNPEQARVLLAGAKSLKEFPQVKNERAELLRAIRQAQGQGTPLPQRKFREADTALGLAFEMLVYVEIRREAAEHPPEKHFGVFEHRFQQQNRRLKQLRLRAGNGADAEESPKRSRLLQMLAPLESQHVNDSRSRQDKDKNGKIEHLRVELFRNAPTVINAVLYDRLFYDGRAASVFNGYDHLGDEAGPDGYGKWIWVPGKGYRRVLVRLPHAAAASQATAPLLSASEMSWFGRQYHYVARKVLDRYPLSLQEIHPQDSALRPYLNLPCAGRKPQVRFTYRQMIQKAFHPKWWRGRRRILVRERDALTGKPLKLTQMEANFSLFWGVAIQLYEETLISDQSPFDELMRARLEGKPLPKTNEVRDILRGLRVFQMHACADCHALPEFASGTFATVFGPMLEFEGPLDALNAPTEQNEFVQWLTLVPQGRVPDRRVEAMLFRPHLAPRLYDNGYYNIGVSPDDPEAEGFDPGNGDEVRVVLHSSYAAGLSVAERFGNGLFTHLLDRKVPLPFSLARRVNDRFSVALGAFKTPTVRNIALTDPYFHDGGERTLEDVIIHYNRPDFLHNRFIHPAMLPQGKEMAEVVVNGREQRYLLKFMKALTDPRVDRETAPFDHPSLLVPISREVDCEGRTPRRLLRCVPATGTPGR